MKISNSLDFSPELERIIYPKSYLVREIGKYMVVSVLTLSQQYSDPNTLKSAKIQSNLIWHAINEVYEPAFGKCSQTATQLQ